MRIVKTRLMEMLPDSKIFLDGPLLHICIYIYMYMWVRVYMHILHVHIHGYVNSIYSG